MRSAEANFSAMPHLPDSRWARWLYRKPLTPRRAGQAIAVVTLLITLASGVAMRVVDHSEFGNVWIGLWWAMQTVTTIGYGDVVPTHIGGRILAAFVMLSGLGFLTVLTATITAALIESLRRRMPDSEHDLAAKLDEANARLERLEAALRARPD